ncbi:hypothetical protein [Sphingomonas sp.]|nr:hypothetical protein [Sphingomonas sp.]
MHLSRTYPAAGEATMRYVEVLAGTIVTVGTLALVAGMISL